MSARHDRRTKRAAAAILGAAALVGCNLVVGSYEFRDSAVQPDAAGEAGEAGGDPCLAPDKPQVDLTDVTADLTLECNNDYVMRGPVYVRPGATLRIQPGTTIKGTRGDPSEFNKVAVLVVQPGARIDAQGTAERPIVFTSNAPDGEKKAGDWGGVVLLGKAVVNQGPRTIEGVGGVGTEIAYGGGDDDDSSGTLTYVRIEYGGFKLGPNNEINGLTFGGVGRGTRVDFVQVRMVLDDCFEFFGGTVNAMHLACQYPQDDGVDWDFGYRGKLQFLVVQQDPNVVEDMNGLEGDNGGNAEEWVKTPVSEPTIYNATLCGAGKPNAVDTTKLRYGMLLRRHTKAHVFNSIVMGFEAGFDAAQYPSPGLPGLADARGSLELRNVIFFGNTHAKNDATANVAFAEVAPVDGGADAAPPYDDDDQGYDERAEVLAQGTGNREVDPGIAGCFDPNAPVFGPPSEIVAEDVLPPSDGFFIPVGYIGAFKTATDPWATGAWAVWRDR